MQAEYRKRAKTSERKPRELVPCGTESAYRRHLRRNERPCSECCGAHATELRAYLRQRRSA